MNILEFREVSKLYNQDTAGIKDMTFSVRRGELIALAGPSGSGKTTALNIAAGLDDFTGGDVRLLNCSLLNLDHDEILKLRKIGRAHV